MAHLLEQHPHRRLLGIDLVDASLVDVAATLARRPASEGFAYVVTPNADHFVRLSRHPNGLAPLYLAAGALLLDSRVVHRLARWIGLSPSSVVTGSDLTALLFEQCIAADEPVTIIGTTAAAVASLEARFNLSQVAHFAPPFGFETDPAMMDRCIGFIEAHSSRFVFLACGSPRQEMLAHRVTQRGRSTGIGLCVGAAIDQIGGLQPRAPSWMRQAGLEWSWRILREPRRLGLRYLQDLSIIPALLAEHRRRAAEAKSLVRQGGP